MENNVYQIKGLRLNVSKDGGVEFNVDEINVPQDVCFKQLELLGTIVEKIQACFMEMKPAIMSTIGNSTANSKRAHDREDCRLKEDIKDREIKRVFESRMNNIKIAEAEARLKALVDEK